MQRLCFIFELNPGAETAYDDAHADVWPEMRDLLDEAGVCDYSIFRDGSMLYAFLKVTHDWETSSRIIGSSETQARWERYMAPLIAWQKDPDDRLHFCREVFRHDGHASGVSD